MKPFIAVLAGGRSPEHEVSLRSGAAVLAGLAERGFSTLPVLIARDGRWHVGQPGKSDLLALAATSPGRNALEGMLQLKGSGIYLVFPALHGRGGEDGSVQTLCQEAQLPCVGSGPLASALGMSKIRSRHAFLGAGLPMAKAYIPEPEARQTTPASVHLERILQTARLELPLFLKADSSGSSLGVERITHQGAFAPALERVRSLDPEWLVEEEITGIEVSCAILGNCGSKLVPLPPVEIRPLTSRFFDYAAKYDPGATLELCPATSLTPDEIGLVQDLAIRAHEVLGCRGVSRSDMILAQDGPYLLETNSIPGLTKDSILPKACRAGGLSFEDFLARLVALALDRHMIRVQEGPETNEGLEELPKSHPGCDRPHQVPATLPKT